MEHLVGGWDTRISTWKNSNVDSVTELGRAQRGDAFASELLHVGDCHGCRLRSTDILDLVWLQAPLADSVSSSCGSVVRAGNHQIGGQGGKKEQKWLGIHDPVGSDR